MINDKPFERWFAQREPNGLMRCDNIYDAVVGLESPEDIYDFVESMMMVAWSAALTNKITAKDI